jgi:hypothetical protein
MAIGRLEYEPTKGLLLLTTCVKTSNHPQHKGGERILVLCGWNHYEKGCTTAAKREGMEILMLSAKRYTMTLQVPQVQQSVNYPPTPPHPPKKTPQKIEMDIFEQVLSL